MAEGFQQAFKGLGFQTHYPARGLKHFYSNGRIVGNGILFQTHYPARGLKLEDCDLEDCDLEVHFQTHYPARGLKQLFLCKSYLEIPLTLLLSNPLPRKGTETRAELT